MITVLSCGLCHGIDRNGDGLDDQWQQLHGISDANGDFDQDGLSNFAEYRFGTDPKNAQSKLGSTSREQRMAPKPLLGAASCINVTSFSIRRI